MKFNFYDQYKDYSNVQLLKIVKKPGEYQVAAVEAATEHLKERQVLQEDIDEVDRYFQDLEDTAKAKADKLNAYKNKVGDFLEPIIKPGTEVNPQKWLNIFLVVIGIDYLWILYNAIKGFVLHLQCTYCSFDITFIFTLFNLIYVAIVIYLLLKKRRWGWILLFADNLFSFILELSESYIFFKYQYTHMGDTSTFLISLIIRAAFIFFLWRRIVTDFFGVTDKAKKETVFVASTIAVIYVGMMYFL